MPTLLAVFGSFLLGVLCIDLAFDIQALGHSADATLALLLGASAIALTATQVVPAAARVVQGTEPTSVQVELARRVARIHVFCFAAFPGYVVSQVGLSQRRVGRAA